MDSKQLSFMLEGLSEWHPFNEDTVKNAPKQKGIYVLRMANGRYICRLRGKSDILYIGSTESKSGLRGRLRGYLHPGPSQLTNRRIHEFSKKYEMEIAWYPYQEADNMELRLLQQYLEDHDELPPLNRTSKKLLKKIFTEEIRVKPRLRLIIKGKKESSK